MNMGDQRECPAYTVIVTGFGPFGKHKINASWETVKEIEKDGLGSDIRLITKEMPVTYKSVASIVPELWKTHQPQLVVHVGVSGIAEHVQLEQLAHNTGYCAQDVDGCLPRTGCCVIDGPEVLESTIDMSRICQVVNNSESDIITVKSTDTGRYLCDFSYYTSLNIDKTCCSFIHVPDFNQQYTVGKMARLLKRAILAMLQQVIKKKNK